MECVNSSLGDDVSNIDLPDRRFVVFDVSETHVAMYQRMGNRLIFIQECTKEQLKHEQ